MKGLNIHFFISLIKYQAAIFAFISHEMEKNIYCTNSKKKEKSTTHNIRSNDLATSLEMAISQRQTTEVKMLKGKK